MLQIIIIYTNQQFIITQMYNGQINPHSAVGQIKQNKIIAADYSRPRKGSYCQYKQDKIGRDVNSNSFIAPTPLKENTHAPISTRRSSISFYEPKTQDNGYRLQKYSSKEFSYNNRMSYQPNISQNNYEKYNSYAQPNIYQKYNQRGSDYRVNNRQRLPQNQYRSYNNLQPYANLDVQRPGYKKPTTQNSIIQMQKNYKKPSKNISYLNYLQSDRNYDIQQSKRYQQPLQRYKKQKVQQKRGKVSYHNYQKDAPVYDNDYRQKRLQRQKDYGLENYGYKSKDIDRRRPNFTDHQYLNQAGQDYRYIAQQPQTPVFYSSKNYHKSINNIESNNYNSLRRNDYQPSGASPIAAQNKNRSSITPNRVKYSQQTKQYEQKSSAGSNRKENLISKSKMLREKLNQLSADKKYILSASKSTKQFHTLNDDKSQSYQERIQRLKNNKQRVYESPFKATASSSTNLKQKYSQIPTTLERQQFKQNHQTYQPPQNRENYKMGNLQRKQQQYSGQNKCKQNIYNSIDNQCMSRINSLNSKINEKINSIINSYGK